MSLYLNYKNYLITIPKIIGGFATTDDHRRGELSFFADVVEQTAANCSRFEVLLGDGLYANRVVCGLLEQQVLSAYFLPSQMLRLRVGGWRFGNVCSILCLRIPKDGSNTIMSTRFLNRLILCLNAESLQKSVKS